MKGLGIILVIAIVVLQCFQASHASYMTGSSYTVTIYEDQKCEKEYKTMVLPNYSPKNDQENLENICVDDGSVFVRSGGACEKLTDLTVPEEQNMAGAGFVTWENPQCAFMPKFRFFAMSETENVYGECLKAKFAFGMSREMEVSARILSCVTPDTKTSVSDEPTPMSSDDVVKSFDELKEHLGGTSTPALPSFQFPSSPASNSHLGNGGDASSDDNGMAAALAQMLLDALNKGMSQFQNPENPQ